MVDCGEVPSHLESDTYCLQHTEELKTTAGESEHINHIGNKNVRTGAQLPRLSFFYCSYVVARRP